MVNMETFYNSILISIIISFVLAFEENKEYRTVLEHLHCPSLSTQCMPVVNKNRIDYRQFNLKDVSIHINIYSQDVYDSEEEFDENTHAHLFITCDTYDIAIDDTSFPRFTKAVSVPYLDISNCNLLENSFANAIKKLNITFESISFYYEIFDKNLKWGPNVFKGFDYLKQFWIEAESFLIDYFDLKILQHLSPKVKLILKGLVLPPFPSWNKFETVFVINASPWNPTQTWGHCDNLRKLTVKGYKSTVLPEGWLANCKRLENLIIRDIHTLTELPKRMLENAETLYSLTITNCNLERIPDDFVAQSKNLKFLDMSRNRINLNKIKGNPFTALTNLETANFMKNNFEARYLDKLKPLTSLKNLNLESNYRAGLCQDYILEETGEITTTWPYMPSLISLSLCDTLVTKPCPEWLAAMPNLKYVNMSISNDEFMSLTFDDIQLIRQSGWEIDTSYNTLEIIYSEMDYKNLLEEINMDTKTNGVIYVTSPLECNCTWYWFIKALKDRPNHISIPDLSCIQYWGDRTPKSITEIDPEYITCALNDCPYNCECFQLASTGLVLINCTNTLLDKIPRYDNIKELVIADNHVSTLKGDDLPDSLDYIDLRNNLLAVIYPETSETLFSISSRKMLLSGNPILCTCENKDFLELLLLHKDQVLDFNNITCIIKSQSVLFYTIDIQILCSNEILNISMIIFGSLVFVVILLGGVYYFFKSKIKSFLTQHGFKFNDEDLDIHKIYDAFISFSYEDTSFVVDELMPILEEENGFKLCVHTRDWMIGDWIPAQIARSVQDSRRTIIVLSKNFLSSIWALLEFRTAHIQALRDKRTRVIIILLEDLPKDVKMDEEMQKYLTTNTYVKWGEPNFWVKLRKAIEYKSNEKQIMKAGEEVAKLYKNIDAPATLNAVYDSESVSDISND